MNFLALQTKVIEKLRERSTPKHWPLTEIKDAINRGVSMFVKDSECRVQTLPLSIADAGGGLLYPPNQLMRLKEVRWAGKPLPQVDVPWLDNHHGGANKDWPMVRGEPQVASGDWRTTTADAPSAWFYDEGLIRLFPIPTAFVTVAGVRTKQNAALAFGATDVVVAGPLPTNENMVDVFLDGIAQHHDQWSIVNSTTIRLNAGVPCAVSAEVVFYTDDNLSTIEQVRCLVNAVAGQQVIVLPRTYVMGINALTVRIDGVTQAPSAFTETSTTKITLATPLVLAAQIEVVINQARSSGDPACRCVIQPGAMVNDADVPDMPAHLDDWHDAAWMWALVELFSREGQTKDMNSARFYQGLYLGRVNEFKAMMAPPILIEPLDAWRV